ncbi:hypothetical protein BGX33_003256 [Mortierella sp. NVP41]|nr:hypothetical protein BGX33_003256 [Mortierella sp. NVP41]
MVACPKWDQTRPFQLDLEDAVVRPWACSKIKTLQLEINLGGEINFEDGDEGRGWGEFRRDGYDVTEIDEGQLRGEEVLLKTIYTRELPIVLTGSEQESWSLLERFFRQIGSLTLLESRKLTVASDPEEGIPDYNLFFPGMLALEDKEIGRQGFLQLLGGLENLVELTSSVSAFTRETVLTIGQDKVEWILAHWTNFRLIEFEPNVTITSSNNRGAVRSYDRPCLQWLKAQPPQLSFTRR